MPSDYDKARETCLLIGHDWIEEYYGMRCANCSDFIPTGCGPWMPLEDEIESDEDLDLAVW